mgnify:FL=1
MQINIIYVGNIKDKYFSDAVKEYEKRLSAYCKVVNTEIKETKIPENASAAQINKAIEEEGEKILSVLPQKSYKIALAVEGAMLSSEELAKKIDFSLTGGYSSISFIIGGAFGMSEKVKKSCDMMLSVSRMTFTHRMMRVIILEQIYRAYNILSGGKYHK